MFSIISTFAFPDDTSMFLLMLAVVTFTFNFVSFYFVRLLPPRSSTPSGLGRHGQSDCQVLRRARSHDNHGQHPSAGRDSSDGPSNADRYDGAAADSTADTHENSSLLSKSSGSGLEDNGYRLGMSDAEPLMAVDVRGLALLKKLEFWQLFLLFGLLSGIGLMNIKYDA